MEILFLFLFGLSIGSLISCLGWRINNVTRPQDNKALMFFGRSVCDHCRHQLSWYNNIPVLSFILLRGKCRQCHSPIPLQYFLVELSTALLTVVTYHILRYDLWSFVYSLLIIYALIAIFISDLNYQIVPDIVIFPAIVMALIYDLLISRVFLGYLFSGLAAGGLFFFLSKLKIKGQQAMGFGDVEIALLMGLFLGFPRIIVALYLAFLTGALVGVILMILDKKKLDSQIAFGPFLVGATIISLFYGNFIWQKIISGLP